MLTIRPASQASARKHAKSMGGWILAMRQKLYSAAKEQNLPPPAHRTRAWPSRRLRTSACARPHSPLLLGVRVNSAGWLPHVH